MCIKCVDAIEKHMKGRCSDDEINYVVWNETAYPFCDADCFEKQIIEYMARKEAIHD